MQAWPCLAIVNGLPPTLEKTEPISTLALRHLCPQPLSCVKHLSYQGVSPGPPHPQVVRQDILQVSDPLVLQTQLTHNHAQTCVACP